MTSMKSLREELSTALVAYQKAAETLTPAEKASHTAKIKELQKALRDSIADGAVGCASCGEKPIGLRHAHVRERNKKVLFYHTFEIGCPACEAKEFAETPPKSASGEVEAGDEAARAAAVAEWNKAQTAIQKG